MWLALTQKNNSTIVVDFGKVAFFSQTQTNETRIEFSSVIENSKGEEVFKSILVIEPVDAIMKLLKVKRI